MVSLALFETSLGHCGIAWRDGAIIATRLPGSTVGDTARHLAARTGATEGRPPPDVARVIRAITALLGGEQTDLSWVACDFGNADPFAAKIYAAARTVPAGETSTYGAIASELGDIRLAQRVGQALGNNPIPIIVPCHRIVGADGKLVGFSATGGIQTKLKMLNIERASIGSAPGLFSHLPLAVKPDS